MRKFFHIVILLSFFQTASAQELPFYGQIFMNPYYYNPAFAGFENRPAFYVYRRQQWTGIDGAPETIGFNFHTIFNEKVNFGLHVMNDKRSILSTSKGLFTLGYRASFDDFHYLSFGLSGGVGFNNINFDAVDIDDPAILEALDKNMFLDGNAGLNYYIQGFNFGISLPRIFVSNTLSNTSFTRGEISPLNEVILMSSYRWEISEDKFAFEPYVIYHYFKDVPGQMEAIGLLHFMNVIWFGGSYRQNYGLSGFVGLNIKDNFKFGYSYEFFNTGLANFDNGTHDLQLALIFGEKKNKGKLNLVQKRRNMLRTMGRLPSQNTQKTVKVENDPFESQPTETETYNEEEALQDLLDDMENEEQVEEDTIDIFNFEFDEVPKKELTFSAEDGLNRRTVTRGDDLLELDKGYYVVVGKFKKYQEAEQYSNELFINGYYTKFGFNSQTEIYYVYIFTSNKLEEANMASDKFDTSGTRFNENWVLTVR